SRQLLLDFEEFPRFFHVSARFADRRPSVRTCSRRIRPTAEKRCNMLVEMRSINSIRPYENNPRQNDAGVDAVAASLRADEAWVAVPGYVGLYEISSYGRLRRSSSSRMAPAGY